MIVFGGQRNAEGYHDKGKKINEKNLEKIPYHDKNSKGKSKRLKHKNLPNPKYLLEGHKPY